MARVSEKSEKACSRRALEAVLKSLDFNLKTLGNYLMFLIREAKC